jgi:hypothetical protein
MPYRESAKPVKIEIKLTLEETRAAVAQYAREVQGVSIPHDFTGGVVAWLPDGKEGENYIVVAVEFREPVKK